MNGALYVRYADQKRTGRLARRSLVSVLLSFTALLFASALGSGRTPAGSPFEWRGVIQGQYGHEFSAAERRRLLRFMAANGFNAYVHAPKDDPYQRVLWRQPYPPARQAVLGSEVRLAERLGIEWIPNVSPAAPAWASPGEEIARGSAASAPICFSDAGDLRVLLDKLEPFAAAGSGTFMVSFDDVVWTFGCAGDFAEYGSGERAFGTATADFLNRLQRRLLARDPGARLLTVTPEYAGIEDSEYLLGFRRRLEPGIEVMWTGPATESRPFSPRDADAYADLIGRAPIVWENWTANDVISEAPAWPARVFLGPYVRRAGLADHVGGFFFNPANQPDLNHLPLATAANWMHNPRHYRARRAFLHQTRRLAGGQAAALRAFAEASYSTTLRGGVEAPTLRRLIRRLLHAHGEKRAARAAGRLRDQLRLAASARRHLLRVGRLRHFVRQARPILRSVRINARAGLLATDLLRAERPAERRRLRHRLRRALRRAHRWPSESFGTRIGLYGMTGNVIDDYAARVLDRDRRRPPHPPKHGHR